MEAKTLLIVDDQTEIIRLIVSQFRAEGHRWKMLSGNNGKIGVEIAKKELPDVILMDWDMPIMSGVEAAKKLQEEEATAQIPIIMVTGQMTSSEDLQIALESGATDYVRKPIDFVELKARVNSVIRFKEQQEAIQQLLRQEIDLKTRKLSTTSMLIVEKNGLLTSFQMELKEIEQELKELTDSQAKPLIANVRRLAKLMNDHLETDDSWETFKVHFEEVHPDFFSQLREKGPDITFKDLKLCAYLKLGMETKQISQLLNITPPSVRTAVYRLKKKFGFEQDDDFRAFIDGLG